MRTESASRSVCPSVRLILLALWMVLVSAPGASAQQVAYAAGLGPELDSATQTALTRDFTRARDRGLPVEPLLAKVREGRLKRAPGLRIRMAVSRLAERLDSARVALGSASSADELVAGSDAIAAGADVPSLRAIRAATTRSVAAPLGTLAQLVASGVDQRHAVEMIVLLLRRNAVPAQLLALGNLVESDVASGLRADESAAIRLRGIEGSLNFGGDKVTATSAPVVTPPPPKGTPTPQRRP